MHPHRYSGEENTTAATRLTFFLSKDIQTQQTCNTVLRFQVCTKQKYHHYNSKRVFKKQSLTFFFVKFVFTKPEIALASIYNPGATGEFITEKQPQ